MLTLISIDSIIDVALNQSITLRKPKSAALVYSLVSISGPGATLYAFIKWSLCYHRIAPNESPVMYRGTSPNASYGSPNSPYGGPNTSYSGPNASYSGPNASHSGPAFGGSLSGSRLSNASTNSPRFSQHKLAPELRSSSPHVERSEIHQTVMTKTSWLETARESTAIFKQQGSPVPLVWVRRIVEPLNFAYECTRFWLRTMLCRRMLSPLAKTRAGLHCTLLVPCSK